MTIQQAFQLAMQNHRAGRLREAGEIYRQILSQQPHNAAVHYNLGNALRDQGQIDQAVVSFRAAIQFKPDFAEAHDNLACVLKDQGQLDQAIDAYRRAIELKPNYAGVHYNLGNALRDQGHLDQAIVYYRTAIQIKPDYAEAHNNLANALKDQGQLDQAIAAYRTAIQLKPDFAEAHNNLGIALSDVGQLDEAIAGYRMAIQLKPMWPEVYSNLSVALRLAGDFDGAIAAAQTSLQQQPGYGLARENLALTMQSRGEVDQAIDILARLVADYPNDGRMLNSLGNVLRTVGRLEEAMACFRRAAEANPSDFRPASNYLFVMQFCVDDPALLLAEHRKWDAQYAAPLKNQIRQFANNRGRDRRLRIGYVSPDFRRNVLALMTSALLPHHNHEQFEIYCYSRVQQHDAGTARLRTHADVWRTIKSISDGDAADVIRADGIDILMDMTMHMSDCRPLLFARKPAPIQVAWLAYPGTTGLSTMDYRITDPYLDPPEFDTHYTEKSFRLQNSFWCYDPYGMACEDQEVLPEPGELPASKNGFITFGCLNDFSKVNIGTLKRWGRLMQGVERSHLRLLAPRGRCRGAILEHLEPFGVTADRIEFVERQPRSAYLAEYQRIDLCLETLPYNSHTTSLDAFWMGVPVLTQIGRTVVGRAGFSMLTNLQLPDFCAEDDDQFIELGRRWSSNLPALAEIRRTLRERMSSSPLMDAPLFAQNMEAAYREMWQRWCEAQER